MILSEFKTAVLQLLGDTAGARYTDALVEQGIKLSLADYSRNLPWYTESSHLCVVSGRDHVIDETPMDTERVLKVYFPYTPGEINHSSYNQFYVNNIDGEFVVHFIGDSYPVSGDTFLMLLAKPHMIEDLDSGTLTTIPVNHEHIVIIGGAAYAAIMRVGSMNESYTDKKTLVSFANNMMSLFLRFLEDIRSLAVRVDSIPQDAAWTLDQWDK